jgi:hypothetical protein
MVCFTHNYLYTLIYKYAAIVYIMSLTLVSPNGFRFFSVMIMVSILIIALVNSVGNILPYGMELLRFCVINLSGFALFIFSIYRGKNIRNPKKVWFNNSFISSGITLIVYANTVLSGAIHSYVLPVFYIVEIVIVIFIGNKLRLETDYHRFQEMTEFTGAAEV